jgi:hypothetical protein
MISRIVFWSLSAAAIVVTLLCLGMPPIEQSRGAARFSQCRNNIKQIELALHAYRDIYGTFPPAVVRGPEGQPWHSWRVLVLPYLDWSLPGLKESPFHEQYRMDEPWDSPHNADLVARFPMPDPFACPADGKAFSRKTTSYVAVVGEGTLWPPEGSVVMVDNTPIKTDGTINIVEISDSDIPWAAPQDLSLETMSFKANDENRDGIRSRHPGEELWFHRHGRPRANVGLVDGSTATLTIDTPPAEVRSMLIRDDGQPKD